MIDRKIAARQIARLDSLPTHKPLSKAGVDELIDTLAKIAHSEDAAKRIINEASRLEMCPSPQDLRRIAHGLSESEWAPPWPPPEAEHPAAPCGCGGLKFRRRWDCHCGTQNPPMQSKCLRCGAPSAGGTWFAARCSCHPEAVA